MTFKARWRTGRGPGTGLQAEDTAVFQDQKGGPAAAAGASEAPWKEVGLGKLAKSLGFSPRWNEAIDE